MEKEIDSFIKNISSKGIQQILAKHLSHVLEDSVKKEITLVVDKKYAVNELHKSSETKELLHAVHRIYGEEYSLILKQQMIPSEARHNREMLVPYTIHY